MREVSTLEMQIVERARKYANQPLTNLHNWIDVNLLKNSFDMLNKESSAGVDKKTWEEYNKSIEERLPELLKEFKRGTYRAPHIRRVYIPKGDGKQRPLGIPTIEDKVLQTAVNNVLTPIYEQEFYPHSYGFRPGKSQHQALECLFKEVSFRNKRYVIDADMKNYFGSINHQCLRTFLAQRIRDKVTQRMIDKWLKAGIFEEGQVTYPKEGTPQGGSISPLLSNIYLHYVLDEWFVKQIMPLLKGKGSIIRFADDFLLMFDRKEDAERVMKVLPKRLSKFGLTLHPQKTKLIDLTNREKGGLNSFDFLGFTHYLGKSRKGYEILLRKTKSKKMAASLKKIKEYLKSNRHQPVGELIAKLNQKLKGHYGYYGITFNSRGIANYFNEVTKMLFKWLNRRGGKNPLIWEKFQKLITEWEPLAKPKIVHAYT